MKLCKIRFDGSHYLAMPYENVSKFSTEEIISKTRDELKLTDEQTKNDLFVNEWALENFGHQRSNKKYKVLYDYLHQYYYLLLNMNYDKKYIIELLKDMVFSNQELIELYDLNHYKQKEIVIQKIEEFEKREKENLINRKKLFKRKALNNEWNYFVTFTYDDSKHTEDSFVKTLKKKLQNLHTNYGWLYMGCFERSKTGRLHFHGLCYVPQGAMRGEIRKVDYYDTTAHKKAISYINSEFEDKLGRNDFKAITTLDYTFTKSLDYILKYIGKSDNKIVYSRGIKDDVMGLVDYENNIICKISEKSPYSILANNNFEEVSKDLNRI